MFVGTVLNASLTDRAGPGQARSGRASGLRSIWPRGGCARQQPCACADFKDESSYLLEGLEDDL